MNKIDIGSVIKLKLDKKGYFASMNSSDSELTTISVKIIGISNKAYYFSFPTEKEIKTGSSGLECTEEVMVSGVNISPLYKGQKLAYLTVEEIDNFALLVWS